MKKNEKNKVILGLATQEPRQGACDAAPKAISAESKKETALSLRGAVGDVAISRVKALSLRGGLMSDEAIFHAKTNSVQRLLSRCCKNVEDCRVGVSRLLAMTPITLALAAVLSLGMLSESQAGETLPPTGSCGNGCLYKITQNADGTQDLRVYNDPNYTGTTKIIKEGAFAHSGNHYSEYTEHYDNTVFNKITIDGNFDTIGRQAFWHNDANEVVFNGNVDTIGDWAFGYNKFTSVNLPQTLQDIETLAFYGNYISSLNIPDSVTTVGGAAFHEFSRVNTVYISDTLEDLDQNYPFGSGYRPNIICKGDVEKCQRLVSEYRDYQAENTIALTVTPATKEQCTGDKYFWNGTSCSRKEAYCDNNMYYTGIECLMRPEDSKDIVCDHTISGYVKIGDNCVSPENSYAKKHYTPAEAAEVLKDTDNEIIMTFKVNR